MLSRQKLTHDLQVSIVLPLLTQEDIFGVGG